MDFALLDAFPDAVVASDTSGNVVYLNAAAERLLGWSRDALVGRPLTTIMPERMHAAHIAGYSQRHQVQAANGGCALTIHAEPNLVGRWDRLRIEQVLTNLLSNAMKYGTGRPIEVSVAGFAGRATISVRDHGMGVAREHMDRIFARFERAVSPRHYGGLGLGLYITRQIVEAHKGEIRVTSEPGSGATFTVELPLAAAAEAKARL